MRDMGRGVADQWWRVNGIGMAMGRALPTTFALPNPLSAPLPTPAAWALHDMRASGAQKPCLLSPEGEGFCFATWSRASRLAMITTARVLP